jgi:hypothetical protein
MAIKELDEKTDCVELQGTIPALTVGRRCVEHGYHFEWKPWEHAPTFTTPEGKSLQLGVDNFVPFMRAMTSAADDSTTRRVTCMPAKAITTTTDSEDNYKDNNNDSDAKKGDGLVPVPTEIPGDPKPPIDGDKGVELELDIEPSLPSAWRTALARRRASKTSRGCFRRTRQFTTTLSIQTARL